MKNWKCTSQCFQTKKFIPKREKIEMLYMNRELLIKELQRINKRIEKNKL